MVSSEEEGCQRLHDSVVTRTEHLHTVSNGLANSAEDRKQQAT